MEKESSNKTEPHQLAKTRQEIDSLKKKTSASDGALQRVEFTHQKAKNDLKAENHKLSPRIEDMKHAFKGLMADINKSDRCEGCKRQWNFSLTHRRHTAFGVICSLWRKEAWYYGE